MTYYSLTTEQFLEVTMPTPIRPVVFRSHEQDTSPVMTLLQSYESEEQMLGMYADFVESGCDKEYIKEKLEKLRIPYRDSYSGIADLLANLEKY